MRDGWKQITVRVEVDALLVAFAHTLPTGPGIRVSSPSRSTAIERLLTRQQKSFDKNQELRQLVRDLALAEKIPMSVHKHLLEVIDK